MQKLLIIGYVWPEPTATAAGSRMLQIIKQFQQAAFQIVFCCPAIKPNTAFDLSGLGIKCYSIEINKASFDDFIKKQNPNIVLFDRFMMEEQLGWRVSEVLPNTIKILDSEDLHFLRKARQQAIKKGEELPVGLISSDEAKREIASIYRCDATLTISEFEMKYLEQHYQIPSFLLWYFPFLIDPVSNKQTIDFEQTQDFMFIGNFIHAPNWDAVLELKNNFWPKIKKQLPAAKLHIYGGYPSEKVFNLQNKKQGFLVHGRTESVSKAMQNVRVCLAPLRFGAGLKGKLIDAMQNNTPFVTTEIGAEGMFGNFNFDEVISANDEQFVQKSINLYQHKELWETMVERGNKILTQRFKEQSFYQLFKERLNQLQQNYKSQRDLNFIGAMLQHHSLQSTKYLSKWIEAKQKS